MRNAKIEPTVEHGGTCKTFFMFPKESIRSATEGSYLEYVSEFEIAPGTHLEPHKHNTHEFFHILSGRALMQVGREKREVEPGDLIHIPPTPFTALPRWARAYRCVPWRLLRASCRPEDRERRPNGRNCRSSRAQLSSPPS